MPAKRKTAGRPRKRGGAIDFEKLAKASEIVRDVGRVLKDTKLISSVANQFSPGVGSALETVGLGRKKRAPRRKRMAGGSWIGDVLGKVGQVAQSIPLAALGGVQGLTAGLSGLGRKKRAPRRRMPGGSAYGSRPVLI